MLPENYYGLATGIGSLPHINPVQALDLIAECFPRIPHWPQLPRRGRVEGLVSQYLHILVSQGIISLSEQGAVFCSDQPGWENSLMDLYQVLLEDPAGTPGDPFALPEDSAAGFYEFMRRVPKLPSGVLCLKGQVCGPVTARFQVTDPGKRPSFYSDTLAGNNQSGPGPASQMAG